MYGIVESYKNIVSLKIFGNIFNKYKSCNTVSGAFLKSIKYDNAIIGEPREKSKTQTFLIM
ncbi:hypothetical protein CLOHAE12215_02039 [Clostridium haemolyticum]|uniref:hypothetical protein n=1 Tax=Clostridium haemolyticum TaxID=84025 RepID=UPI001C3A4984|nr:hypothetical protein [Clostridium haemolyticum]CAG7840615.1 hypothetical protein CLOHAE12215_02039 [Clostridium haemolyticum]